MPKTPVPASPALLHAFDVLLKNTPQSLRAPNFTQYQPVETPPPLPTPALLHLPPHGDCPGAVVEQTGLLFVIRYHRHVMTPEAPHLTADAQERLYRDAMQATRGKVTDKTP